MTYVQTNKRAFAKVRFYFLRNLPSEPGKDPSSSHLPHNMPYFAFVGSHKIATRSERTKPFNAPPTPHPTRLPKRATWSNRTSFANERRTKTARRSPRMIKLKKKRRSLEKNCLHPTPLIEMMPNWKMKIWSKLFGGIL